MGLGNRTKRSEAEPRSLTLFEIEHEMAELMDAREEAATDEERAALDEAIAAYVGAELKKVDGIRGYIRNAEAFEQAAREEAERQQARARAWRNRADRLKQFCLVVMQQNGLKKLEGRTGALRVQNNGGLKPVIVTDVELLPSDVCVRVLRLTERAWIEMRGFLVKTARRSDEWLAFDFAERRADNDLIRAALDRGEYVPGARLEDRGVHLRVL